jgi:hypothetical protein
MAGTDVEATDMDATVMLRAIPKAVRILISFSCIYYMKTK